MHINTNVYANYVCSGRIRWVTVFTSYMLLRSDNWIDVSVIFNYEKE